MSAHRERTVRNLAWMSLLAFVWAAACADPGALANASRSYQERGDYASLKILAEQLHKGMSRQEVEALFGPPDLEPSGGHSVYSSDRKEHPSWADRELFVALLVEYSDENGKVTDRVQSWDFRPIGE